MKSKLPVIHPLDVVACQEGQATIAELVVTNYNRALNNAFIPISKL
jgi:hypothetical protein